MPVGAGIAISGVVGAGASLIGANQQANATRQATDVQRGMYDQTRTDLEPYRAAGQQGTNMLMSRLGELTSPIQMDQATLANTPGYQFALTQGLKGVQNSASARGLGTSGAALKGAASYATGLAKQTYLDQYNIANQNQTNAYNRLLGVSQQGQNAATQTGAYGVQTGQSIGSNIIGGANAQAAGIVGAGNALTNATGQYLGYNLAQRQLQGMYPGSI